MKTYTLKCPSCDATLEVDDGINTFFCKYCGRQILVEGQSDAEIKAKLKIKEMAHDTEIKEKQLAHEKEIKEKQLAHEQYKIKQEAKQKNRSNFFSTLPVILALIAILAVFGYFKSLENSSDKQESELQSIVDEIIIDVENHNFDEAYIKANSLHYTENWSSSVEEKWNTTREVLIEYIEEAEQQAEKDAKEAAKQAKKEAKAAEKQAKKEAFEEKKTAILDSITEKTDSITNSISQKVKDKNPLDFLPF